MAEDFLIGVGKDNRQLPSNRNDEPQKPEKPPRKNGGYDKAKNNKTRLKGCGFGCLGIIVMFSIIVYWVGSNLEAEEAKDLRITYLKQDLKRLSTNVSEENVYSHLAKVCIDSSIYLEGGGSIDKGNIGYFTRRNDTKLLVILKVEDLKNVDPSTRRVFVDALLDCYSYVEDELGIEEYYISVEGFWNTLLVKTPNGSDLGGKFADDKLLLPFYDEYVKDSLPSLE